MILANATTDILFRAILQTSSTNRIHLSGAGAHKCSATANKHIKLI